MIKCTKYLCLMMLAMFVVTTNANTVNITITEGVAGIDGFSSQVGMGTGSIGWTESVLRIGYAMNAVTQTYFVIPDELKAPGVVINNATITLEFGDFYPGSTGINFQMVHLNYDAGMVSFDNANATNDPAKYTKVGDFAHMQGSYPSFAVSWDVASVLAADIAAGNTYLPLLVRMTRSDGTFYPDSEASDSLKGIFWATEFGGSSIPKIVVDYSIPEPASMLLIALGAMALRRRCA
jgi:hypothetical protein